ncbi:SWI/SNF-related matrix-associated actin-dependent regulator of chromatin subfamily A containing DEAD/H box 1 homolog [Adelges cooleyi]|uniref:SWI/SNF-related matrix-associated actin-dependent regulator of chromatin subfamily A containing DEAD/H box 1 homolog n=1 Tax=Adelges cooleyi TaxID=133065 RepID=UPI0021800DA7|nr:SWI/SNF-related matrix-associated actin-dependent regulator of chromatin subfamily A containing DEAD/H box 1 homolog [Adelges cooleyi]XP_050435519.1 SWI/SNF-related matrix-associated actin-dependent regulator of chromatin subfamily A containing DEAD/H box 1 homolog [Adelges cooleyi]
MNSPTNDTATSPSLIGNFRYAGKPSFSHEAAASSSNALEDSLEESPFKVVKKQRMATIIISSDEESDVKPTMNGDASHVADEIESKGIIAAYSISEDDINRVKSKGLNGVTIGENECKIKCVKSLNPRVVHELDDKPDDVLSKVVLMGSKSLAAKPLVTNVNSPATNSKPLVEMPSRKRIKLQNKKSRKRIRTNDGDNSDSDGGIDDEFEEYKDEQNLVKDSSTEIRERALELLNNATEVEMRIVKGMTTRKFEALVALRPFANWFDAKSKVNNSKVLGDQALQNVMHVVNCQEIVTQLMKKCEKLSLKNGHSITTSNMLIKTQPASLNKDLQLAGYQMIGLNWLMLMNSQKLNMMLADEMGLGKTVQIIAFLAHLKETGRTHPELPQLIVVPASTLDNWYQEFERWCPSLKVEKYHGSMDERRYLRSEWIKYGFGDIDVILTTYSCAANSNEEKKMFRTKEFHYIIYDEAHKLKNMTSQTFEIFSNFNGNYKILLTGTPLQNNLLELMSLLIFLMPKLFRGKVENIKFLFSKGAKNTSSKCEMHRIEQAKRIIEPFMLRRLKADVLKSLPVKTIVVNEVSMSEHQLTRYSTLAEEIKEESREKSTSENNHMMWVMMLRKLTNHPLLLRYHFEDEKLYKMAKLLATDPTYKQKNEQYIAEDLSFMSDFDLHKMCGDYKCLSKLKYDLPIEMFLDSGKFKQLDQILPDLKDRGHRVLIFSQFLTVLDLLEIYMSHSGHSYLRLDGSTQVQERQLMIDLYNMDESVFAFLLSTKAGGLGINLTSADTVIFHDIDYNPYNDKQAEDRCHRVGQTKPVNIIKFISKDSIEQSMFKVAQEKLNLEQQVTGGGNEDEEADKLTMAELLKQSLGLEDAS